jgi:hypothetical protein
MNKAKYLDSSIQILKEMLGDQSNELESKERRALEAHIRKLKRLAKQSELNDAELYSVVSEIAETISKIL